MKKITNFFNSVSFFVGLFFLILTGLCLFGIYALIFLGSDALFLKIVGSLVILLAAGSSFDFALKHLKRWIKYIRNYSMEERLDAGDVILCRVRNGKVQ